MEKKEGFLWLKEGSILGLKGTKRKVVKNTRRQMVFHRKREKRTAVLSSWKGREG